MNKNTGILVATLLSAPAVLLAPAVNAEISFHGGLQWGSYDYSNQTYPIEVNNKAVAVIGRMSFLSWLSAEVRGGTGVGEESTEFDYQGSPEEISLKIKAFVSTYLRPEIRFKYLSIYGLVGASEVKYESNAINVDLDQEGYELDFSYGAGIALVNSDEVSFGLEYVQLVDTDVYSLEGVNFAVEFRF